MFRINLVKLVNFVNVPELTKPHNYTSVAALATGLAQQPAH